MKQTIVAGVLCLALLLTACGKPIAAVPAAAPLVPSQAEQSEPASSEPAPAPDSEPEPVVPPIVENESEAPPEPAQPPAKAEPAAPAPPAKLEMLYSWNPADYTYNPIANNSESKKLFAILQGLKTDPNARILVEGTEKLGFLTQMTDGTKQKYIVSTQQVYIGKDVLNATVKQCKTLLDGARKWNKNGTAIPQWLAYMSEWRMDTVKFNGGAKDDWMRSIAFDTKDAAAKHKLWDALRKLAVEHDSTTRAEGMMNPNVPADLVDIRLVFASGVTYTLFGGQESIWINSSDMDFSLGYTLKEGEMDKLRTVADEIQRDLTATSLAENLS